MTGPFATLSFPFYERVHGYYVDFLWFKSIAFERHIILFFSSTGVALGSYIFTHVVNSSYTIMFIVNATLLALAILYSLLRLEWQTSPQQQPLSDTNLLTDFFDSKHIKATMRTLTKSRRHHGTLHLWILLLTMSLYTFQRDEKPMSFLYTQLIFNWDVTSFSNFRTFQSTFFVIGQQCT